MTIALRRHLTAAFLVVAASSVPDLSRSGHASDSARSDIIVFNDNGAWSWFDDDRVVADRATGTVLVSSVANADGADGARRDGNVEVVAYDVTNGRTQRTVLHAQLESDDHDSASLYLRRDGRYVAMYSGHARDTLTRWRVSRHPGDATSWEPERMVDNGAPTTYSNIHPAFDEGALYAFVRAAGHDPNVLVSDDDGMSWARGGRLLDGPAPYVRYSSDTAGRIHLVTTEHHPRQFSNGVYHAVIDGGRLLASDGTVLDDDLTDAVAVGPDALTEVFPSRADRRAWTIDVRADDLGRPHVVFSVRSERDGNADRHHYYGWFDGIQWHVDPLARAGSALYSAEADYTGLVALDPANPWRLVLSTDLHPLSGAPLISQADGRQHHELFAGETTDGGGTWCWTPLTSNSIDDNLRPVVPEWDADHDAVLWLRGHYTNYQRYDLEVVGLVDNHQSAQSGASVQADCARPAPPPT